MMNKIKEIINSIDNPHEGFSFHEYEETYWGKDYIGNVVFGLETTDKTNSLIESTKSLSLLLNVPCEVEYSDKVIRKNLNILILKDINYLELFISLSQIFVNKKTSHSFIQYFLYLKELFGIQGKKDIKELRGLYGELFTMHYFKSILEIDISPHYQSEDKMKFDFSFSDNKKMDVKTTLKEDRIHHFRNEQLNSLRYDIKIVSILLLKDDKGLSLFNLIQDCKIMFSHSLITWINIEKAIKNYTDTELKSIRFNQKHLIENIKIYDSSNIPRLTEKTKDGIFNIEYDSDLTFCEYLNIDMVKSWASNILI